MQLFDDFNEEMMLDIIQQRKNISIKISDDLTGFTKEIPDVDFSREKEIPPTKMILTREGLSQIMYYTTPDVRGRYNRFVVFVYAFGGKIFYKKLDEHYFEAKLEWS